MIILCSLVILTVVLNVAVSRHVHQDNRRLGYEKVAEIGLIWVLPIMGALISLCITFQNPAKVREYEDTGKFFSS